MAAVHELELRVARRPRERFGVVDRNERVASAVQHENWAIIGGDEREAFEGVEHGELGKPRGGQR
jgi:hypothetical protein